jgi:hypothetical protein
MPRLTANAGSFPDRARSPGVRSPRSRRASSDVGWRSAPPDPSCWLVSLFNAPLRGFMQMVPEYLKPITFDASKLAQLIGKPSVTGYEDANRQTLDWLSAEGATARH